MNIPEFNNEPVIQFNAQQIDAIEKAVAWYKRLQDGKTTKRVFFIAGYAGTGKTSIAREIVRRCVGEYGAIYIAPTGKAASRLKQKGCRGAKTLHQFIYNVRGVNDDNEPIFSRKSKLDEKPHLVVLDEASMVGEWDTERLLDHRIPVLALGDIGQVPPVKAAAYFTEDSVDVLLTEIMRQGKESNIIRASFFVRQGNRLPPREYDDVKVLAESPRVTALKKFMGEDDQIICSYNSTKDKWNSLLRQVSGRITPMPGIGEKVICTFNQHGPGFCNGEQGIVISYEPVPDFERDEDESNEIMYVNLRSLTDGKDIKVKINPLSFSTDQEVRKEAQRAVGGMDYGYVITVHKSQGSEWDNVCVLEEILRGVPYSKMMYTAITRAKKNLTVYRDLKAR